MNLLTIALILGVFGVNFVLCRILRVYIREGEIVKQYKKPGLAYGRTSREFYFAHRFDLTNEFDYTKWDDFLKYYSEFKMHRFTVEFYRDDKINGVVRKTKIIQRYPLINAKVYDYDIDNVHKDPTQWRRRFQRENLTSPEEFLTETLSLDFDSLNPVFIFDETITLGASYQYCGIQFALQQYVQNGHLMLRSVYHVILTGLFTGVGSTVDINTGEWAGFYENAY